MSLYQCEECGCLENTALGWYWVRNRPNLNTPETLGKKLCSACSPSIYPDGTTRKEGGVWHNRFERIFLPKGMFIEDGEGSLVHKDTEENYKDYLIRIGNK